MMFAAALLVSGIALSSTAADHPIFVAACEAAVKERLPVAETYRQIATEVSDHFLTREEFLSILTKFKIDPAKRMAEFDAGSLRPRDVGVTINYEATDEAATLVQKRSYCSIRINRQAEGFEPKLMRVDGDFKLGEKWISSKKP